MRPCLASLGTAASHYRPSSVTDELGRTTGYLYDAAKRLVRVTAPEGDYVAYTLDARGNATETRRVAKPGSGVADIVTSATFPCTAALACNRPATTTDALGAVTDYAYDAGTGQISSVTRRVKRE